MENAFLLMVTAFLKAVVWQIVMFFLCGIAFELFLEFIKASLFPKKKDEEAKPCPRWLGLIMGVAVTVVYIFLAYSAYFAFGAEGGFLIPGGVIFIPIWSILFFFWQYKALKVAKWLCSRMFPTLKNPFYEKPKKETKKTPSIDELVSTYEKYMAMQKTTSVQIPEGKPMETGTTAK